MCKKLLMTTIMLHCLLAPVARAARARVITLETLLDEMVDRDQIARFPVPQYRLRQQSSYDRGSKTPDDPEGWFANKDRGHFIRTETNNGRKEWVLAEHNGAGTMGRTWMPDPRITPMVLSGRRQAPTELGTLRVYLDGESEPALEGPTYDLFNGTTITSYPFGHKSLSSAVSYLPIPWAKGCKITMDVEPQYYIFTYREYAEGTKVRSFTTGDLKRARNKMRLAGHRLVKPKRAPGKHGESLSRTVAPRGEVSVKLPAGTNAICELSVKLGSYDDPQVTRSVVLRIDFDGRETVWCPIGDFFGTGVGLHPFKGWYRTVTRDGTMTCRWVMPYLKSAKVSLLNLHNRPVQAELEVAIGGWDWDDRSMYFHSSWRHQSNIKTMPRSDWNYITLNGRGVYVGDTLTIWNPKEIWWGEGDAKIWVDGESFPSIFGTGTEDYYAYSYGGQNRRFYEHPFHAQVRVMDFDQNYTQEIPIVRVTQGYSTETRTRTIDAMPFGQSLQVDMEIWHWAKCEVNYNVATYWYARPGTTCNVDPSPEGAKRRVEKLPD
ncbi:MAG: DUF2961 domain-containing protein [Phycisphaerae bacterium]|nr:DUF2961 domain-containing protein [Phycisphaerae bacterium]